MKRRITDGEAADIADDAARASLYAALLSLKNVDEVAAFLSDLCTPAELEAMVDRWRVVPLLQQGMPYRQIHECTAVSITTIGRVARYLTQGSGGYLAAAARVPRKPVRSARRARA